MNKISVVVETIEEAHNWCKLIYDVAKAEIRNGKKIQITCDEAGDIRSLLQNRWYWGPFLGDISEQASIGGIRYTKDMWHEYGKREFLPRAVKRTKVAGRKHPVVTRSLGSTSALSVRKMADYLERYMAFAVTDLGVQFTERRWEDYGR